MIDLHMLLAAGIVSALIVWLLSRLRDLGAVVVTPDGVVMRLPPEEPEWAKNVTFKKGGGSAPDADPNIGKAALEEMQLGRDWLAFSKEQFNIGNVRQDELDALTKQVTEQQLKTQEEANAWAREDRDRYKNTFQPLQDEFIETAKSYDTPEKQEAMAAEAVADVKQASQQATDANARNMASMGVNPNSGRWQATSTAQNTLNALSEAGAANTARQQTRDKALALKADAINMGNGLASSTANAYGIGLNAGNSATGNAGAANANWRGNVGIVGQGYGGAMQGLQGGAGILNQQYGTQMQGWGIQQQNSSANAAGLMSGVGTIAGAGIMAF